ncbi:hypothetical protein XENORESO_001953 [Xenotaenia resolanae]|uniref:Uncharacterized protein n=1 Tax=Xenotaenia resolanae TaxID=208358 RepID=A0ABV0VTN9_9TELE
METLASGMSRCSHVSVKHIKLHFRYSLWLLASTVNSSILLAIDLTLPMETEGRDGLNLLFSSVGSSLLLSSAVCFLLCNHDVSFSSSLQGLLWVWTPCLLASAQSADPSCKQCGQVVVPG